MRPVCTSSGKGRKRLGILGLLSVLICSLILASCAEKKPPHKRIPRGRHEVIRPAEEERKAAEFTPQRAASQQLVENGLNHLDEKNYELAAVRFQDAINVDPRNGEAYYYLALSDYYLEQYDTAIGLLDKALSLLTGDEAWMEKIENLKASILADTSEEPTEEQPL